MANPRPTEHEMEVARAITEAANLPARIPAIPEAVFEELCARVATGRLIAQVCADEDMPNRMTLYRYLAKNENWMLQLSRARMFGQLCVADEIISIAYAINTTDTWAPQEYYTPPAENGAEPPAPVAIARPKLGVDKARIMIQARKWVASKLAPRIFGDNEQLDVGHDVQVTRSDVLDVSDLDDEELDVLERVLAKTIEADKLRQVDTGQKQLR